MTATWPSASRSRNIAPANGDSNMHASQLRVDTTQIHPYMNIFAPLAWTAIASLTPDKAGKVSLDQLGFRSPQATQGTSKILLTQGTGKLAVNISKAPTTSVFVKALNVMISGRKDRGSTGHPAGHQRACAQRVYRGAELLGRSHKVCHGRQPDHRRGYAAGA